MATEERESRYFCCFFEQDCTDSAETEDTYNVSAFESTIVVQAASSLSCESPGV